LNSTQRHPDRDDLVRPADRLLGQFLRCLPLVFYSHAAGGTQQ